MTQPAPTEEELLARYGPAFMERTRLGASSTQGSAASNMGGDVDPAAVDAELGTRDPRVALRRLVQGPPSPPPPVRTIEQANADFAKYRAQKDAERLARPGHEADVRAQQDADIAAGDVGGYDPGAPGATASPAEPTAAAAYGRRSDEDIKRSGWFGLSDDEIKSKAAGEFGKTQLNAASPQTLDMALRAFAPRMVGVTKGGMVPSTEGHQAQTESKVFPKEYYDVLKQLDAHGRSAAEGNSIVETETQRALANSAAERQSMLAEQAKGEEAALKQEGEARAFAQDRINRAITDYQASGPRFENYGTLFNDSAPMQQVAGFGGMLLGLFGQADTGQPSAFTAQLDKMIEQRAQMAEAQSKKLGQVVGMRENAFSRLERSFGDARAARATIRALYIEQAKAKLEQSAAQIGISSENPRYQSALAELDQKMLAHLKEGASVVTEGARNESRYAPPRAIMAQPTSGFDVSQLSKEDQSSLKDFEAELQKRQILQQQTGVALMSEGLKDLKGEDPGKVNTFMHALARSNPERWGQLAAQLGSSPGNLKFVAGMEKVLRGEGGKALPAGEMMLNALKYGSGSLADLETGLYTVNRSVQDQFDSLRAGPYARAYQIYSMLHEKHSLEGRAPQDVRGLPHPVPQTEPAPVSPDGRTPAAGSNPPAGGGGKSPKGHGGGSLPRHLHLK